MQRQRDARVSWPGGDPAPVTAGASSEWPRALRRVRSLSLMSPLSNVSLERWVRHGAAVIALIALGYVCAKLFWVLFFGATLPIVEQSAEARVAPAGQQPAQQSYDIFATFDPFSRRAITTTVAESTTAPETNLDLKLYGLRAGITESAGSAIIKTPDNRQASYAVGDEIISGVVLRSVLSERALISRNGVTESLSLNPDEATGTRIIQSNQFAATDALAGDVNRLSALIEQLQLQPRILNGGVNGFFVNADGAQASLLDSVGLEPADVILSVNDVRLVSMERVRDVIEEVNSLASVNILVERDGAQQTLTLEQAGR